MSDNNSLLDIPEFLRRHPKIKQKLEKEDLHESKRDSGTIEEQSGCASKPLLRVVS